MAIFGNGNDGSAISAGGLAPLFQEIEDLITESDNGLRVAKPAAGGGGNYTFTPAELEAVLGQWKQLHDTLESALPKTNPMTDVQAPATDTASQTAVSAANQSGQAYVDHLTAMITYSDKYIQALNTALENYRNAEETGSHSFRSVDTSL